MSREDVEVVRRVVALNNQRSLLDRGAIERLVAADCEFSSILPATPTFVGHDGAEAYLRQLFDSFDEWSAEVGEIVDAGDGRVVLTLTVRAHGRSSGATVDSVRGAVFEVHDGQVHRGRIFPDPRDAYAAVGLEPPAPA